MPAAAMPIPDDKAMDAVRLHAHRELRVDSIERPKPGEGQVLVRMKRVGICGSDVHMFASHWEGAAPGTESKDPLILGHEGSGVVAELGPGVTNLKVGDRVALEPTHKSGKYEGLTMLAEYHVHRADKCHKLADHVTFEEAAMCEPFAISLHAVRRAKVKKGDRVLVLGAGPIGQLALIAAKGEGAGRVVVADVKAKRLEAVKAFGADAAVDVAGLDPKQAAEKAKEAFAGEEIDVVVDAAGHEATLETGCLAVKEGGVVQMVGIATVHVKLNLWQLLPRELEIRGSWFYGPDYPTALRMITDGTVNLKPLASHHIGMGQAQEGYQWCEKGEDPQGKGVLKVMF
ncbi:chaperonin 10-like protein, partial [Hyaloraphidium curvatum]